MTNDNSSPIIPHMAAGFYANGLPHPSAAMRTRIAVELGVVVLLTFLFVIFAPENWRNNGTYIGLALVALGFIAMTARTTREDIWGPPDSPEFDRVRRCATAMSALTIPPVFVFLILGAAARYWNWLPPEHASMFGIHFFLALVCYVPWAMLQQTLFQFYLLGRLRA